MQSIELLTHKGLAPGDPFYCDAPNTCVTSETYLGCCSSIGCAATATNYFTSCLEEAAPECASTTRHGVNTLCCTGITYPFCVTLLTLFSGTTLTGYVCGNNVASGTQILSPTPPQTVVVSTVTNVDPPPDGGGSSTNVGAIVGGVIGGLALIGIFVFVIFWLVWKPSHAAKRQPSAHMSFPPQMQMPMPPPKLQTAGPAMQMPMPMPGPMPGARQQVSPTQGAFPQQQQQPQQAVKPVMPEGTPPQQQQGQFYPPPQQQGTVFPGYPQAAQQQPGQPYVVGVGVPGAGGVVHEVEATNMRGTGNNAVEMP